MTDLYELLELPRFASAREVRQAFKKMAFRYHPDRNPGNVEAEEHFKLIHQAYQTLSDPAKKATYDQWLRDPSSMPASAETPVQPTARRYTGPPVRPEPPEGRVQMVVWSIVAMVLLIGASVWGYGQLKAWGVKTHLAEAHRAVSDGYLPVAIARYKDVLHQVPDHPEALAGLAQLLMDKDPAESLRFASLLIATDQSTLEREQWRVAACRRLDSPPKEVLQDICQNLALYKEPTALLMRADILLYQLLDYQGAMLLYRQAAGDPAVVGEATLGIAVAQLRLHDYEAANATFKEVFGHRPVYPEALYWQGLWYWEAKKDPARACACWQEAHVGGVLEAQKLLLKYCP